MKRTKWRLNGSTAHAQLRTAATLDIAYRLKREAADKRYREVSTRGDGAQRRGRRQQSNALCRS
jgi:hypothetical protein